MDEEGVEIRLHGINALVELLRSQDPEGLVEQGRVQALHEAVGLRPSDPRFTMLDLLELQKQFVGMETGTAAVSAPRYRRREPTAEPSGDYRLNTKCRSQLESECLSEQHAAGYSGHSVLSCNRTCRAAAARPGTLSARRSDGSDLAPNQLTHVSL